MLPTVQFDPSTLAIWTTTANLTKDVKPAADQVLEAAFAGQDLASALEDFDSEDPRRARLLWLASCVWHEKRHFFDTCLTNYGAFRFRRTFGLAANFLQLVSYAESQDCKVWFPIEVYGCPVRRRLLGLEPPPEGIIAVAEKSRDAKRWLYRLDAPAEVEGQKLALGGEAQLEGLAHVSQLNAFEHQFGVQDLLLVQKSFGRRLRREGSYRMIETVAGALGSTKRTKSNAILVNAGLASSIFFTALCVRRYGDRVEDESELIFPGYRLTQLVKALGARSGSFEMSDEEAWARVNEAARKLWGRDAIEEIEADIDGMERVVSIETAPWLAAESLIEAWTDFIALRRRLLSEVKAVGPASLGPRAFPELWVDKLKPWRVVATPGGDSTSDTSGIVFGRSVNRPPGLGHLLPEFVVWGRLIEPLDPHAVLAVANREAWLQMLERHVPRALLMENGRRHRLMIPPQLERPLAEMRECGLEPCFEPQFEYPEMRSIDLMAKDALELSDWSERPTFCCDVTGEEIDARDAVLLTPWEYRRSELKQGLEEQTDDLTKLLEKLRGESDWSDWIVKRSLIGR